MKLDDALAAYKILARAEGRSEKTIKWIAQSVGYFADFLGEKQEISSITGDDLRRFIIALRDKDKNSNHPLCRRQNIKLSLQSIETYCRAIRAFFGHLEREGFVEGSPMKKVKMPKVPKTVVPTFSEKEIERLLAVPNKERDEGFRDYAIMLTFIDTGIRLNELVGLRLEDIDYPENILRVMGKGARERYVPFGHRVAKALMKYQVKHRPEPVGTDRFWLNRDGTAMSGDRVEKLISMYGKKAGLKRAYAHKMRHTSSVMYLRNGGDPFSLQRKLGHRTLAMTRHYSELADRDVRDKHLKYGVADKLKL